MSAPSVTGHAIPDKASPIYQEGFFVYSAKRIKRVLDRAKVLSTHGFFHGRLIGFKHSPFKKRCVQVEN
jgi:hypothetical protein